LFEQRKNNNKIIFQKILLKMIRTNRFCMPWKLEKPKGNILKRWKLFLII